jgi:succinate-semialdehyde dehydrogenase / glutarate-semialdehyde dehydrogenase
MQAINPATGQVIAEYPDTSPEDLERATARASDAFLTWRRTSFEERAAPMRRAAELLRERAGQYGALITEEMGKTIGEARAEVEKCGWVCDFYAEHAEAFLAPEPIETDGSTSYVRYDPLGPVLAVMPWNFPFWQVFRFIAPTVMAGNTGLLKHASNVPGSALAIEEVMRDAGFPTGVFQTLLIGSGAVEGIIRDPRVAAVTLTGSEPAGQSVASIAGDEIKPVVLELGGSDPFIILNDADVDLAIETAVSARLINGGQSCIAAKRFIVEEPHYERAVEVMADRLAAKRVGDPLDETTEIGPLAREDLVEDLQRQVDASVEEGARLVTGGQRIEGPGAFYQPTLLADCRPSITAFREETFGPVAAVVQAEDTDHAIELANASVFGLGASLWTSTDRADELAPRIESGHVAVNGIVKSDPRLPFGGVKRSGVGRELGVPGIRAFVNQKAVWIA